MFHLPTPLAADNVSRFTASNTSLLSTGCVDEIGMACVDGIALFVTVDGLGAAVVGFLVVTFVVVECDGAGGMVIGRLVVVSRWLIVVAEVVDVVVVVWLCWC